MGGEESSIERHAQEGKTSREETDRVVPNKPYQSFADLLWMDDRAEELRDVPREGKTITFTGEHTDGLLTAEGEDHKVDRRKMACMNCMQWHPNNCIALLHASHQDHPYSFEATGTAVLIAPQLALTSAHLLTHLNPYTHQMITLTPKRVYLDLKGEIKVDTHGSF